MGSLLDRWDPFRDLMSNQNELNRLFGRTYGGGESSFDKGVLMIEVPKREEAKPRMITVKAS